MFACLNLGHKKSILCNSGATFLPCNLYRTRLLVHAASRCFDLCCLWDEWNVSNVTWMQRRRSIMFTSWWVRSFRPCCWVPFFFEVPTVPSHSPTLTQRRFVWWPWVACISSYLQGTESSPGQHGLCWFSLWYCFHRLARYVQQHSHSLQGETIPWLNVTSAQATFIEWLTLFEFCSRGSLEEDFFKLSKNHYFLTCI